MRRAWECMGGSDLNTATILRTILDRMDYDGIIKLYFTFQDPDSLCEFSLQPIHTSHLQLSTDFGLEYCEGGDLYEQIQQVGDIALPILSSNR